MTDPITAPSHPLRLGVSACLLGRPVRYDGQLRSFPSVISLLTQPLELVEICPEWELGLGVPRAAIDLHYRRDGSIEVVRRDPPKPLTECFARWWHHRQAAFVQAPLDGLILKARSPSCDPSGRVPVLLAPPGTTAPGVFFAAYRDAFPHTPSITEEGIADERTRDAFMAEARQRWRHRVGMAPPA